MSDFQLGAGFRICGVVSRTFTNQAKTFASLTLETPGDKPGKKQYLEMKAFAHDVISLIEQTGKGETVQVTGHIGSEKLIDKAKNAVQIDGRDKFVPSLVVKAIKTQVIDRKPLPRDWNDAPISGPAAPAPPQARGLGVDEDDRLPEGW